MRIRDLRGKLFEKSFPRTPFKNFYKESPNENKPLNTVRFHSAIFRYEEVECNAV